MTTTLQARPMALAEIPSAAESIRAVLPLLHSPDPLQVAAVANAILQTAADIRLTANLKSLNESAHQF